MLPYIQIILTLFVQGIIGRVSQYAEYIVEPPEEDDETESDSESEVELPNRVSQFEANIFEQMTQQAYEGEILSGKCFDIVGLKAVSGDRLLTWRSLCLSL